MLPSAWFQQVLDYHRLIELGGCLLIPLSLQHRDALLRFVQRVEQLRNKCAGSGDEGGVARATGELRPVVPERPNDQASLPVGLVGLRDQDRVAGEVLV